MIKKNALCVAAAALTATLAFSPATYANDPNSGPSTHIEFPASHVVGQDFNPAFSSSAVKPRILNGSSTASRYYRVGVRQFEKGNLEKAEKAFKAVLRARGLNKQALYYLTQISAKQGDEAKLLKYNQAYHALNK